MRGSERNHDRMSPFGGIHEFWLLIILISLLVSLPSTAGIMTMTSRQIWPTAPDANGLYQAVGEIGLRNDGTSTVRLKKAEILLLGGDGDTVGYRKLNKKALRDLTLIVSRDPYGNITFIPFTTTVIKPGEEAIIFVEARGSGSAVPASVTVNLTDKKKQVHSISVPLAKTELPEEAMFPLQFSDDDYWIALNTADVPVHRLALYYKDDESRFVSQRHAVDLIQIDGQGRSSRPAGSARKEDYFAWDEEILSPAAGVVMKVVDGNPDMEIGFTDEEHPGGNYVVIKHAEGWYSLCGHMKQGSVTVAEGETVEKGLMIGRLGNSGNTSEPHLHIQFMDRWVWTDEILSLYEAEGIPMPLWGASAKPKGQDELLPLNGATLREEDIIVPNE